MKFMLYNIRYGTGFRRRTPLGGYLSRTDKHVHVISRFVRRHNPDIVGLVEVDSGSFRTRNRNQAEIIAQDLGHYHRVRSKYQAGGICRRLPIVREQVNAFITRDAIQNEKPHYFDRGVKRLVMELELEQVRLYLVHLSLRFRARQHQLADLYDLMQRDEKPRIVAGDFNAFWGDHEIRLFLAATGLKSANEASLPTFPSWAPKRELDFVMYSEGLTLKSFERPAVRLSDHMPLVCNFDVN